MTKGLDYYTKNPTPKVETVLQVQQYIGNLQLNV